MASDTSSSSNKVIIGAGVSLLALIVSTLQSLGKLPAGSDTAAVQLVALTTAFIGSATALVHGFKTKKQ